MTIWLFDPLCIEIFGLCREEPEEEIKEVQTPESISAAGIDFGGKAQPKSLVMRGVCSTGDDNLRACFWKTEENTSNEPVSKYIVQF